MINNSTVRELKAILAQLTEIGAALTQVTNRLDDEMNESPPASLEDANAEMRETCVNIKRALKELEEKE